jgi:hypothetical protein
MDWTMILAQVFASMELASGFFIMYGGWICMRHLAGDWRLPQPGDAPVALYWMHAA